ncbi:MAG: S9 family peptidase [Gemmatimonadales bacterium]|jgi:dipeptidyl aminopeptidase/acylaminoacyl peptidase|nr:S9 family peptidase [Gemmatimonadales bacterium]
MRAVLILGSGLALLHLAQLPSASPSARGPAAGDPVPVRAQAAMRDLATSDLYRLRSVGDVRLSPDGRRIAYSVTSADSPGRPRSRAWITDLDTGRSTPLGNESSNGRWSPDGSLVAWLDRGDDAGEGAGLMVSQPDGSDARLLVATSGTNHPLPGEGERISWSPDGTRIASVSSTPGPETDEASGDPMVITRYLYKPTASEGMTRFNDNRRLHVFVADLAAHPGQRVRQLTDGPYYEHSIAWSPRGDEILFVSNREPDPDRVFNNDLFAVDVADRTVRRLTDTRSAEYQPAWSPDGRTIAFLGTTRPLTSSETTMEDTHVWVMDAEGRNRREAGAAIDNRQERPAWSPEGDALYFTVEERGSVRLYRLPVSGGAPSPVAPDPTDAGAVSSFSVGRGRTVAFSMATRSGPAELFRRQQDWTPRQLTSLNRPLLAGRTLALVESIQYGSGDLTPIEAFLTRPVRVDPGGRHPLIAMIKGGPHAQQGPVFNAKAQIYAAHGFAVLMVNYRGSTGYGQAFADAIFKDQNGGEANDVLAGVDAALAKYSWLDPQRLGIEGVSYGGQLTNWLITRTPRFKAAIPTAGISNLVTQNYLAYYHDYLAVEFGGYPHEQWQSDAGAKPRLLMDVLWERSPLRHVANVKTPVLLLHGENDSDVPIAEAEQFYIALKDAGVETVMVRYPREGHGLRETVHVIDSIERSIAWYEAHW